MTSKGALSDVLSPTANVRRSCRSLMADPLIDIYLEDHPLENASSADVANDAKISTNTNAQTPRRSVGIYRHSVDVLATKIADQILTSDSSTFAEWDEHQWHYTAQIFSRPLSETYVQDDLEAERVERVLLYILALDAINFCFWPSDELPIDCIGETKNMLEYEHLATALKKSAEKDDCATESSEISNNTYFFAPRNLIELSPSEFLSHIQNYLPNSSSYCIPNATERVRLLNELGAGLLYHYSGSATELLQKCISPSSDRPSAVQLVDLLISTFRGFRDEAVSPDGRQVCFYKRAQIAVGDIWAAFGRGTRTDTLGGRLTNFDDIDQLTTFADYRVPQLLRHVGVLRYSTELSAKVDAKVEIVAGSADEMYIRAGTVVAVEELVGAVKKKLEEKETTASKQAADVNAVLLDWHLWQVGEALDRDGTLKPHHRVRTIFY